MNLITVIVEDGIVQDVQGLPDGCEYQVADFDFMEECDCESKQPFTWNDRTIRLGCFGDVQKEREPCAAVEVKT